MAASQEYQIIPVLNRMRDGGTDYQDSRIGLTDFLDNLLNLLDTDPDYRSILLDGQAAVLEDYLRLRPESRQRIMTHVASGRLQAGPWYAAPECFLVSGEALLRNLCLGRRFNEGLGGQIRAGYLPGAMAFPAQLPQIYAAFGIEAMATSYGPVLPGGHTKNLRIEGADGAVLLAVRVVPPSPPHTQANPSAVDALQRAAQMAQPLLPGGQRSIALLLGHEHLSAASLEAAILKPFRAAVGEGRAFHGSLTDHLARVMQAKGDSQSVTGEVMILPLDGADAPGIPHARPRVRRLNALATSALVQEAEPWSVAAWLEGVAAPRPFLDLAWRHLLQAHTRECLGGLGPDAVEEDAVNRLNQARHIASGLGRRAIRAIASRMDTSSLDSSDVLTVIFNSMPSPRNEIATATIELPPALAGKPLQARIPGSDRTAAVQCAERRPKPAGMGERAVLHIEATDLPALGFATYRIEAAPPRNDAGIATGPNVLENEVIRAQFSSDGTCDLTLKSTGAVFPQLHYFEDSGEAGGAMGHIAPDHDERLATLGVPARISVIENGPLLARLRVEHRLEIPAGLEDECQDLPDGANRGAGARRSAMRKPMAITSIFTLRKGAAALEVETRTENHALDHRLRLMLPTGRKADACFAETPFDVTERAISELGAEPVPTLPMLRFVDLGDAKAGLAVIAEGLHEYEVLTGEGRVLALTLFRAYPQMGRTADWRWLRHQGVCGAQCPGAQVFRYWLHPHKGGWETSQVLSMAAHMGAPVRTMQVHGGHPGTVPLRKEFVRVEGAGVEISALKMADNGDAIIIRLYCPAPKRVEARIVFGRTVKHAALVNANEDKLSELETSGDAIRVRLPKKRVVTVRVVL